VVHPLQNGVDDGVGVGVGVTLPGDAVGVGVGDGCIGLVEPVNLPNN
jgi:hypothetical protein